jgi:hypothetical protein
MDGAVELQVLPTLLQRLARTLHGQSFTALCQNRIPCMLPPEGGLVMHRDPWPCPPIWHEAIEPGEPAQEAIQKGFLTTAWWANQLIGQGQASCAPVIKGIGLNYLWLKNSKVLLLG